MNLDVEVLTSEKFAEFSEMMMHLADKKRALKVEFKKVYDKYNEDIKNIDDDVLEEKERFEAWLKERELNVGDG